MLDFLSVLSRFLSPLWEMSATAAYAAAVVIILRLLLKKRAPKQVLCLLWLVVFARLLIPVSLESPLSIVPDTLPGQEYLGSQTPNRPGTGNPVTPILPQGPVQDQTQNQPGNGTVSPVTGGQSPSLSVPEGVSPTATAPEAPAAFPWQAVAAGVWLTGAAAMGGCALVSYLRLRRRLFAAIRAKDGAWEHPAVDSPFIIGIARPRIYVPAGLMGQPRQFILCHERAHLRRLDHIVKPVCWIALALHWFNPLVWAAFLLMSRDIEAACDEAVVRQLGSEIKADYSDTLLALATGRRLPAPCPLAFDEGDARGRIRNVLNYRRPALWAIVISVIAAVLAAVCLLTDPVAAKGPEGESDSGDEFTPVYTLATGDGSGAVLVTGLGDAHVEWSGPDTSASGGGWLYFTNPVFCCPSLAGKQVMGSALWTDETRTAVSVVMNVNDDRTASLDAVVGFYIHFNVELDSGTVLERVFNSPIEGETLELTDQEMIDMARAFAELLTGAEDYYNRNGRAEILANPGEIPAQVQADAEAFVRGRFEDLRDKGISYGIEGTSSYITDEIDLPELDDWRIESLTGPYWSSQTYWDILDVGRRVELWHVVYGYHSPTPDKAWTLANGGTNLTEDGWLTPINYGAEYLLYELGEDGSRTLLTVFGEQGEVSSVGFRRHIRAALAKDSMADTDFAMEDMEYPLSNLGRELDLNGNGVPEYAQVAEFGGQGQRLELWEGRGLIYAEEGYYVHAGYNAVFLCTLDGKDYLLRYHPYMGQGWCDYSYELFTLTPDGKEQMVRENSLAFDINFGVTHESFDPEAIAAFMDEINDLLAHSVQLINTDDLQFTFQKEGRLYDSLSWLDEWEPVFARDKSVSLLENLRAFQKAMEAQWYAEEPVLADMNETEENAHVQLRYEDKSTQFDTDYWCYSFQPAESVNIQVLDLNGDGKDEIVFPLVWAHGTGVYIEKLYVFDAGMLEQYDTSGLNEMILNSIESTGDEDNFYLTVGGERVTVPKSKAQPKEDPDAFVVADKLSLGSIIRYTVEDGQVSCWLACDPSGMSLNYIGFLKITLELTPSGSFSCGSAQYIETDTPFG